MSQSRRLLSAILTALVLISLPLAPAWAQKKVPVIRGSGAARDERIGTARTVPKALAQSTLREITRQVGTEPGETYFELSSRHPYEANRGFLRYQCARTVDGELNHAAIYYGVGCSSNWGVELVIRPVTANSQYVVDCTVNKSDSMEFTIKGPNNFEQKVKPQIVDGDKHLVFVFLATGTGWSTFRMSAPRFNFNFCRATTLK